MHCHVRSRHCAIRRNARKRLRGKILDNGEKLSLLPRQQKEFADTFDITLKFSFDYSVLSRDTRFWKADRDNLQQHLIPSARAPAALLSLPSSLLPRGVEYCARGHSIGQRRRPSPSPAGAPVGGALPALPVGPSISGGKAASITRVVRRYTQPPVPSYAYGA